MLCSVYSLPTGILRLPWLRVYRAFSSAVRQMPGYSLPRKDGAQPALFLISELCCSFYCLCRLCCSMYCLCVNVYTALLPPGDNPISIKCIISYHIISYRIIISYIYIIYHISYHIPYHIILYRIIKYNIIYHIIYHIKSLHATWSHLRNY